MQYANPSWQLVLNYEHRLRKEADKMASRNNRSLVDALKEARENAMLKETHFVGPLALEMAARNSQHAARHRSIKSWRYLLPHSGSKLGH